MLPEGKGVTYEVFAEPDPQTQAQNADDIDNDENEKEPPSKVKHVSDVVSEPNMYYFEIPRLGAYLAVPMVVKSYLNAESFDDAILKLQAYAELVADNKKEKEKMEKDFEDRIAKAKENEEDFEEIIREYNSEF